MAMNAAASRADWGLNNTKEQSAQGGLTMSGNDGQPMGVNELFPRVRARLKAAVGEDVFNSWFARLELEEIVDDLAHLSVPTRFLCSWVQSNYAEKILDAQLSDEKRREAATEVIENSATPGDLRALVRDFVSRRFPGR